MSHTMKADLPRADYYLGGWKVSKRGKGELSLKQWNHLMKESEFSWVERNIEGLSSFMHQGLIMMIFEARVMSGLWSVLGHQLIGLGFGTADLNYSFMVSCEPAMIVEFTLSSSVPYFLLPESRLLHGEQDSFFTLKITLHFKEVVIEGAKPQLQAHFEAMDDQFSNRCHMRLIPTGEGEGF